METLTPENATSEHDRLMAEASVDDTNEAQGLSSATQDGEVADTTEESTRAAEPDKDASKSTPDNSEPSAEQRARDEHGKFVKKEAEPAKLPGQESGQNVPIPTAPPTKEQKEAARLGKSWQQLDQEKSETRQLRDELRQLRTDLLARQQPPDAAGKFDSKQFERASHEFATRANKLLDNGDIDGAKEQFALADQTRAAAQEAAQAETQHAERQFASDWKAKASEVIREVPELGDGTTELSKGMAELLQQNPILGHIPDGFKQGYEILKLRHDSAEASGLREENTKLKTEIERLTKLTTPAGGKDPAQHSKTQNLSELPLSEMHARLEREAELADAA